MIFRYEPGVGVSASHNGEELGSIAEPRFAALFWGVFFGEEPVNGDLKEGLLSRVVDS